MKKIFIVLLCAMLILALPIAVSAEESANSTPETNTAVEGENSASEQTFSEQVVEYFKTNYDKVLVVVIMAGYSIVESKIRSKMNGSIGTLNNNAVSIANNSANAINTALAKVDVVAGTAKDCLEKVETLMEAYRVSEEDKKAYKDALVRVENYLNTAKLANIEFANELAELLCLSNIPNAKKDELYSKHLDGVHRLEAAEAEEVKSDDGNEA